MRKSNLLKALIAVLAAMMVLTLVACPEDDPGKSSAAKLNSLKIGTVAPDKIPTAISSADWNSDELKLADDGYTGTVLLDSASNLTDTISASQSSGAKIAFGTAFGASKPESFGAANTVTLTDNCYLYVRVTAENGKTVYYRFLITTKSTNTTLTNITIDGISPDSPATKGNTIEQAGAGLFKLGKEQANDALVEYTSGSGVSVKYAKTGSTGTPTFGTENELTFDHNDILYLEVTAEDGVTVAYYKFNIDVGSVATLAHVSFSDGTVPHEVTNLGTPDETQSDVGQGAVLITYTQPDTGFTLIIRPTDSFAKINYVVDSTSGDVAYDDQYEETGEVEDTEIFVDGEYLHIKVTSYNGTATLYYKISVNFRQSVTIAQGFVEIYDGFVDSKWDDVPVAGTIKKFGGELAGGKTIPDTNGTFKVLYDDAGLYLWAKVTDPTMNTKTSGSAHEVDSVELFINEKWDAKWGDDQVLGNEGMTEAEYNVTGGQYRVDIHGVTSGHTGTAVTAFRNLGMFSTLRNDDEGYYIVTMQAPWRYLTKQNADGTGSTIMTRLEAGYEIGLEVQINACTDAATGTTRDEAGVIVWNNVANSNYQDVRNYGVGKLAGGTVTVLTHAETPVLTSPGDDRAVIKDADVSLSVTVSNLSALSSVTYEWHKATGANADGTPISGATTATLAASYIDTSALGDTWYWLVVTNTDTAVTGRQNAKAMTPRVRVRVMEAVVLPSEWSLHVVGSGNIIAPVFGFDIPSDANLSDYSGVSVSVKPGTGAAGLYAGRFRVWGSFPLSYWSTATIATTKRMSILNAGPNSTSGVLISSGTTKLNEQATDYYTETTSFTDPITAVYSFTDGTKNWPIDDDVINGVRLLAIGYANNNTAAGNPGAATDTVTDFYIKDVVLVHKSDASKNLPALHPMDSKLWSGEGLGVLAYQGQESDWTSGSTTASITLATGDPTLFVEKVEAQGATMPVYGFEIPADKTLGANYNTIKAKFKVVSGAVEYPSTSSAVTTARVWGSFPLTHWPNVVTAPIVSLLNAWPASGALISSPGSALNDNGQWHEVTFALGTNADGDPITAGSYTFDDTTKAYPTGDDSTAIINGIRMFAVGYRGTGTETDKRSYLVKDIVLVDSTGDNPPIKALPPDSPKLWGGDGAQAGATGHSPGTANSGNYLTRTLLPYEE
jgi:hypothetical protein